MARARTIALSTHGHVPRRADSGRLYYFLILNGFRIDPQILSGATIEMKARGKRQPKAAGPVCALTPRSAEQDVRTLGQRIAANLGLNYFDEPNVSEHRESVWSRHGGAAAEMRFVPRHADRVVLTKEDFMD